MENSSSDPGHPDRFSADLESHERQFPVPVDRPYDVFLSYKSEDGSWVERLWKALTARGLKVWVDQKCIRPGDIFVKALHRGVKESKSVVAVVSPGSAASGWMQDEVKRARSFADEGELQLIPILLRSSELPTELEDLHLFDFSDPSDFECKVDELVWPGITGQSVTFYPLPFYDSPYAARRPNQAPLDSWRRLVKIGEDLGLHFEGPEAGRVYRMRQSTEAILRYGSRLVVVVNIFDTTDYVSIRKPLYQTYIDFIYELRKRTRDRGHEVVFLLYNGSADWDSPIAKMIDPTKAERLQTYFKLYTDIADDEAFKSEFARVWRYEIQRDLVAAFHRICNLNSPNKGGK